MSNEQQSGRGLQRSLGTWEVMVAGIALVVAATTLVSDFAGYFTIGSAFFMALLIAFCINLFLGMSVADLSVAYPKAGALYDYAGSIFGGKIGQFLGIFLALTFYGMFGFAIAGETLAGAFGLQSLLGLESLPINIFVIIIGILAVIPNIIGIKTTAWVSAGLLIFMLGIRWFFGLAGFLGMSNLGAWSAGNLDAGIGLFDWGGEGGVLAAGLTLAFWSFVGIEFAASLAEEVKDPKRAMPRGIIYGLIIIFVTSLVMGFGVTGTQPIAEWQASAFGDLGCGGDCPQLAVGELMFGGLGRFLMALASVAATLGSLAIAYAAMPRILYSIASDGKFFGPLSNSFGSLHPKYGTPVVATIFSLVVYTIPSLLGESVIDWIFTAAYVWSILYVVFHLLAILNRQMHPKAEKAFEGSWFVPVAVIGILGTLFGMYYAFLGAHGFFGYRAAILFGVAFVAAVISYILPGGKKS